MQPIPSTTHEGSNGPPLQVIVVGAGVSGLACAQHLLESPLNFQVTVLEARHRPGGRVLTHWLSGVDKEAGTSATSPSEKAITSSQPSDQVAQSPPHPSSVTNAPPSHSPSQQNGSASVSNPTHTPPVNLPSDFSQTNRSPKSPRNLSDSHQPNETGVGAPSDSQHSAQQNCSPSAAASHSGNNVELVVITSVRPSEPQSSGCARSSQAQSRNELSKGVGSVAVTNAETSRPHRHCFFDLARGNLIPLRTNPDGSSRISVDTGASILHGCGDDFQHVFKLAIQDRIRAPIVAGGSFYESTEYALWYDQTNGTRLPTETISEVHQIFFMASRYTAAFAALTDDFTADMESVFRCGLEYTCEQLGRTLNATERALIHKISARSMGYCAPMSAMALMQAGAGIEASALDAIIGVPHEEDDPPFPGEVPVFTPAHIKNEVAHLERGILATQSPARGTIASRRGGPGDRIVLDGYTPFLVDKLRAGVDIRFGKSVAGISKVLRAPVSVPPPEPPDGMANVDTSPPDPGQSGTTYSPSWSADPEVQTRTVLVSTRCGEIFHGDIVVVTVPLGVLHNNHEESRINFSPPLSETKTEAIRGMDMGVHNKIVLRFKEEDIFWPPSIPQFNCLDIRFQFFNLHSYGKTGVLLVHLFAESGFAKGHASLPDEVVLIEVMLVLAGMFCEDSDTGEGQAIAGEARMASARSRMARALNVCENCHSQLEVTTLTAEGSDGGGGAIVCKSCSFPVAKDVSNKFCSVDNQTENSISVDSSKRTDDLGIIQGSRKLTWDNIPLPEEYMVTRWDQDPYSLGSYSYMPQGSDWLMIDHLAASEPLGSRHPYLYFAGEHCSDVGWQCVHGAYDSGIRVAQEIIKVVGGQMPEAEQPGALLAGTEEMQANAVAVTSPPLPTPAISLLSADERKESEIVPDQAVVETGETSTANREPSTPVTEGVIQRGAWKDKFWTTERERALTRALIGYSDVYGNVDDVIDEIAYALQTFKKEPTDLDRPEITQMVLKRIAERVGESDAEAKAFVKFHKLGETPGAETVETREDVFPRPFEEAHKRPRLIGLNGNKLKEKYSQDIVDALTKYAGPVSTNQISFRETLRKIAVMIYRKDGGLMTKRCLSEYLRTQEFGTGPQKELYLGKYGSTFKSK